jgi:hypothetical protein
VLIQTTKKPYIMWVTGPALGSAKTWTLALLGYALYLAGYTIITNFNVSYPHEDFWKYYYDIKELFKLRRVAVLLDDVNNIPGFDSRRASDPLNILFSSFGQGSRKTDRYLFFSCPRLLWGEIRMWDIASIHIFSDHLLVDGVEMVKWEVLDKRFDPPKEYVRWFNASSVYPLYDTEEMMPPAALTERANISNVPVSGKALKSPILVCPRCNTSSGLMFSRRDGVQYCRKCGWERGIKRGKK